jgi:hypothetical protein
MRRGIMTGMDFAEIRSLVASHLAEDYPPLLLSFYGENSSQRGDNVIIGNDCGTELCVRLNDGAIYSIDPLGALPIRFVNSSIEQLAGFIRLYNSWFGGEDDAETEYPKIREEFRRIDGLALNDPENWWCCILDDPQIGDGLADYDRK